MFLLAMKLYRWATASEITSQAHSRHWVASWQGSTTSKYMRADAQGFLARCRFLLRRADLKDLYRVVYEGNDGAPPWKRLLAALDDTSFRIRYRQLPSMTFAVTLTA